MLRQGGQMVTYGGMGRKLVTVSTLSFIFKELTLKGFWLLKWINSDKKEKCTEMRDYLLGLRSMPNGKLMRRGSDASSSNSHSPALKRGCERRTNSTTMYVPRNNSGNGSRSCKEKSTYVQVNKRDDPQHHPVSISGGLSSVKIPSHGPKQQREGTSVNMFQLNKLEHTLRLKPDLLSLPINEAIQGELEDLFVDKIIENLGLCISVYDIESIDGGFIFANEGAPTYKICLQLLFNISLKKLTKP
ncbi:hypothetical protein LXL04_036649 [Taraxacum kok-saghyz]